MDNIKAKRVDTDYESIAQSLYTVVITNKQTLCNELLDRLCWQLSFTGCEKSIVTVLYETVYRLLVDQPNVCIMWFWTMIRKQLDDMGQDQICLIVKTKLLEEIHLNHQHDFVIYNHWLLTHDVHCNETQPGEEIALALAKCMINNWDMFVKFSQLKHSDMLPLIYLTHVNAPDNYIISIFKYITESHNHNLWNSIPKFISQYDHKRIILKEITMLIIQYNINIPTNLIFATIRYDYVEIFELLIKYNIDIKSVVNNIQWNSNGLKKKELIEKSGLALEDYIKLESLVIR